MKRLPLRWMGRRIGAALEQAGEPEVERLLIAGAVVLREGDHFRIASGAETSEELDFLLDRAFIAEVSAST